MTLAVAREQFIAVARSLREQRQYNGGIGAEWWFRYDAAEKALTEAERTALSEVHVMVLQDHGAASFAHGLAYWLNVGWVPLGPAFWSPAEGLTQILTKTTEAPERGRP